VCTIFYFFFVGNGIGTGCSPLGRHVCRPIHAHILLGDAGYSTASSVEDWALALEICEQASLNEANAKEAVTALKKEFK
jgi:hypothetical protein